MLHRVAITAPALARKKAGTSPSRTSVTAIGKRQLGAISSMLGDNPFLLGEKATSSDASLYGFLASLLEVPLPAELKDYGRSLPNLVAYCQRMRDRFTLAADKIAP